MKSVNNKLEDVPAGSAAVLAQLMQHSYICHRCEKIFKAVSDELYFFPDDDATYHRHPDAVFHRAFTTRPDGSIEIGAFDSVEEDVIQGHAFRLDAAGERHPMDDLRSRSKAFFDSMKRQNRRVTAAEIHVGFGD